MNVKSLAVMTIFLLTVPYVLASGAQSEIVGRWRGTSTCVDHAEHPACHDEVVVYDVTPSSSRKGAVSLDGKKVVNGKELSMGILDFEFDQARQAWVSEFRGNGHQVRWTFVIRKGEMSGTLTQVPTGDLIRRVSVKKSQ